MVKLKKRAADLDGVVLSAAHPGAQNGRSACDDVTLAAGRQNLPTASSHGDARRALPATGGTGREATARDRFEYRILP
ncbi:hypothetical protein [Caballeronia sp. SL2Y3]|uniref:hypothetical protein n=1 Tax=Caballeronia sp. SL2Y3 TaxID=2878151 RepID=UPI001FD4D83C|nr:hypothetical protein [Caballeronia sp. SL2Y3]